MLNTRAYGIIAGFPGEIATRKWPSVCCAGWRQLSANWGAGIEPECLPDRALMSVERRGGGGPASRTPARRRPDAPRSFPRRVTLLWRRRENQRLFWSEASPHPGLFWTDAATPPHTRGREKRPFIHSWTQLHYHRASFTELAGI